MLGLVHDDHLFGTKEPGPVLRDFGEERRGLTCWLRIFGRAPGSVQDDLAIGDLEVVAGYDAPEHLLELAEPGKVVAPVGGFSYSENSIGIPSGRGWPA